MYHVQLQHGEETDMLFIYTRLAISQYMLTIQRRPSDIFHPTSSWLYWIQTQVHMAVPEDASSCFLNFMAHTYAMCQWKIGKDYGICYIGLIHRTGLGSDRIVSFCPCQRTQLGSSLMEAASYVQWNEIGQAYNIAIGACIDNGGEAGGVIVARGACKWLSIVSALQSHCGVLEHWTWYYGECTGKRCTHRPCMGVFADLAYVDNCFCGPSKPRKLI